MCSNHGLSSQLKPNHPQADVGIVVGSSSSLRRVVAAYGVQLRPLVTVPLRPTTTAAGTPTQAAPSLPAKAPGGSPPSGGAPGGGPATATAASGGIAGTWAGSGAGRVRGVLYEARGGWPEIEAFVFGPHRHEAQPYRAAMDALRRTWASEPPQSAAPLDQVGSRLLGPGKLAVVLRWCGSLWTLAVAQ
jgi:hypothetical protein